jgi:hypothetical protein
MRSMRSMRGGFIFRSRGPLQKVCLRAVSVTDEALIGYLLLGGVLEGERRRLEREENRECVCK